MGRREIEQRVSELLELTNNLTFIDAGLLQITFGISHYSPIFIHILLRRFDHDTIVNYIHQLHLSDKEFITVIDNLIGDINDMQFYDKLLSYDFNINCQPKHNDQNLLSTIIRKNPSLVEYFINKGIDVNSGDGKALETALHFKMATIVKLLFDNGFIITGNIINNIMQYFKRSLDLEITNMILHQIYNQIIDHQIYFEKIIMVIMRSHNNQTIKLEIFKMLNDLQFVFNEEHLLTAIDTNNPEIVEYLIQIGITTDQTTHFPENHNCPEMWNLLNKNNIPVMLTRKLYN
jgi:hypothetical protein